MCKYALCIFLAVLADARVRFPGSRRTSHANRVTMLRDEPASFLPVVPVTGPGPKCAEGLTYCENTDDYPREYIASLLKNDKKTYKILYDSFGNDSDPGKNTLNSEMMASFRSETQDEKPLCPSNKSFIQPKMAQNENHQWLFVVNQEELTQGIEVENCQKDATCALSENLPNGYKTTCKQKYISRKMVALNENGRMLTDSFRIPSCCVCHYTSNFDS